MEIDSISRGKVHELKGTHLSSVSSKFSLDYIVMLVQRTARSRPTMERFLSFDEVMERGYASKIEQMEVFQEIKEKEVEMVEQVSGGHVMVEEGHQICVASSSCK